jgi:magnesium-dependent phosphatase 1
MTFNSRATKMTKAPVKLAGELPQMVVFDLDYTLWPLWCDTHVTPPLLRRGNDLNQIFDRHGEGVGFYPDVPDILLQLHHSEIHVAAASRTHAPKVARQMLSELTLNGSRRDAGRNPLKAKDAGSKGTLSAIQLFDSMEIYPGSKLEHFRELNRQTGIPFEQMVRSSSLPPRRCESSRSNPRAYSSPYQPAALLRR